MGLRDPFGRVCETRPEARAGDDLEACEASPPNRCASRRSPNGCRACPISAGTSADAALTASAPKGLGPVLRSRLRSSRPPRRVMTALGMGKEGILCSLYVLRNIVKRLDAMRRRAVLSRALALARLEARARWSCTEQSVSDKPVIFISYSHKDRAWLDYVRSFFEPLAAHWNLQIWDDEKLRIGDDWRGDIYAALYVCRVFILLVSRYALASSFIINEEVGRILKRPKGEVRFCPIVVTPYYARPLPWLDQPNRRPPDNKSLFDLPDAARDREMAIIAEQIDKIIQTFSGAGLEILPAPPTALSTRKSFPSIVDYGRLPETPYKTLVGRETELKQLDGAWADRTTRIISLIAWGGAGKTSLVMEWLTRVRNDAYRGADAVLCWSFYSQGTQERAAAGEGLLDWALSKLKVKIDTTSSAAKGERLAEELSRRRVLLVLDGLEPLQFGPEGQEGALKEHGLRTFLRALAMRQPQASHSLVVITSR